MICECTWKITFKGNKTYMPICGLATTYIPCCWCLKMIPIITNRTNNNVPCEKKAFQCISQRKSQQFVWWNEYVFTPLASNDSTYLMISSFILIKKIIEELFIVNVVVEVVVIIIVVLHCIVSVLVFIPVIIVVLVVIGIVDIIVIDDDVFLATWYQVQW